MRVLLHAEEALTHELAFGIDGLVAALDLQPLVISETLELPERPPIVLTRRLEDILAIGMCWNSSRGKKILRLKVASGMNVTYQIEMLATIERLLRYLHVQWKRQTRVVCVCVECGGVSQLSRGFLASSCGISEWAMMYECVVCASPNVREISLDKMVALCGLEGIVLSCRGRRNEPDASNEAMDNGNGFFMEENVIDTLDMYECHIMPSGGGMRETMVALVEHKEIATIGVVGDLK